MKVVVDPSNLTVRNDRASAHLTRCEFAIVTALIRAGGRCLTYGFLCECIEGITGKEVWLDSLRVHKSRSAQKLSELGVAIRSHYGVGYSMAKMEALVLPTAEEEIAA